MHLPLLFHFNQHLNEHALLASQTCYRGLLRTLRANPAVKANIHISGTLLTALKWLDPEPLELIRNGLADGQFELVGSTFAQNIPYATDDWDNARQIELHQHVLTDTFGVTPTAFWNPERCWRQSLVPLIATAGYRTITIEDHILAASGGHARTVYQTRAAYHTLNIIRDDETLKHLFNFAAWFGNIQPLLTYLDKRPSPVSKATGRGQDSSGEPRGEGESVLCYAEDAEAMGLWGYFQGVIPNQTWDRLDALLKALSAREDVRLPLFADLPAPTTEITPLADGAAAWMNASLAQAGRPYHEDGFTDWFDFNTRSPKLAQFRQFYTDLRHRLQTAQKSITQAGPAALYQLALHSFLTHQYEFGCIGIGGEKSRGWMGARAARLLASTVFVANLSKRSGDAIQFTITDSLAGEAIPEWLHAKDTQLLVSSPVGGRLLYWVNLENGQLLVGNPSAVVRGNYEAHAVPPPVATRPHLWLPDGQPHAPYQQTEQPPTRLAKFLPAWVWQANPAPVSLAVRDMPLPGETMLLTAQQGAFCDDIWLDGHQVFSRNATMHVQGTKEALRFYTPLDDTTGFQKKYLLTDHTVTVRYTFTNPGPTSRTVRLATTSELALDYAAVLQHGRAALAFLPDQPGVINPLTGETLTFIPTLAPSSFRQYDALLALMIEFVFEFSLAPGAHQVFSIQLKKEE